jgi:hypothetical protein
VGGWISGSVIAYLRILDATRKNAIRAAQINQLRRREALAFRTQRARNGSENEVDKSFAIR